MQITTYNQAGQESGKTLLPKDIFGLKINSYLINQVVVSQMANRRRVIAHTKDRSEVRGGGKKPWRQKGTGRARHGSIRSPLWRGGGVTFGPRKEKVFKKIIPQKMKRKALFMALSGKLKNNSLILLDELKIGQIQKEGKALKGQGGKKLTQQISSLLRNLPCKDKKTLIVLPEYDKNIILAARNIPEIKTIQAKDLNALDLLSFKFLLMPKESIKTLKETFLK
ncbi:MAG: 50S ribosomal protein L4 [Patescibacteria group bacterium]